MPGADADAPTPNPPGPICSRCTHHRVSPGEASTEPGDPQGPSASSSSTSSWTSIPCVADERDRRLAQAGAIDGAAVHRRQPQPAALVEAQRVEVVVGRDQPQPRRAGRARTLRDGGEQRAADALPRREGLERDELALAAGDAVGRQPGELLAAHGDERRQRRRVVLAAAADDRSADPQASARCSRSQARSSSRSARTTAAGRAPLTARWRSPTRGQIGAQLAVRAVRRARVAGAPPVAQQVDVQLELGAARRQREHRVVALGERGARAQQPEPRRRRARRGCRPARRGGRS